MTDDVGPRLGLALVRAVVDEAGVPLIRVVRMDDVFGDEQVIVMTRSPDDAGAAVSEWLWSVLGGDAARGSKGDGDGTVTP